MRYWTTHLGYLVGLGIKLLGLDPLAELADARSVGDFRPREIIAEHNTGYVASGDAGLGHQAGKGFVNVVDLGGGIDVRLSNLAQVDHGLVSCVPGTIAIATRLDHTRHGVRGQGS